MKDKFLNIFIDINTQESKLKLKLETSSPVEHEEEMDIIADEGYKDEGRYLGGNYIKAIRDAKTDSSVEINYYFTVDDCLYKLGGNLGIFVDDGKTIFFGKNEQGFCLDSQNGESEMIAGKLLGICCDNDAEIDYSKTHLLDKMEGRKSDALVLLLIL